MQNYFIVVILTVFIFSNFKNESYGKAREREREVNGLESVKILLQFEFLFLLFIYLFILSGSHKFIIKKEEAESADEQMF